jgi:hypothetical protein
MATRVTPIKNPISQDLKIPGFIKPGIFYPIIGLNSDLLDIAIVTKVRTYQRHSRENGNPWVARLSRWIPACAGMTGKCPMDHGYSYIWQALRPNP